MTPVSDLIKQPSSAAGIGLIGTAIDGMISDGRVTSLRVLQLVAGILAFFRSESPPSSSSADGGRATNTTVSVQASVIKTDQPTSPVS